MRIITGSAKGIRLNAPRGLATRPTADRVKESVFNILGDIVLEARVLDIFAGTGNLGLEALSRGAASAVFVDSNIDSIAAIKENARRTQLIGQTEIVKSDVMRALDKVAGAGRRFELIFCDPPYNKGFVQKVLRKIDETFIVMPGGVLVIEHSKHEEITGLGDSLEVRRVERYGETVISFFLYHAK